MEIVSAGLICARGRNKDAVASETWEPPSFIEVPFQDELFPVYQVSVETLKDRAVLGGMRRADRFAKMAILAAHDALKNSSLEEIPSERIGIIFATAFGPHNTTFKFQDDIIDYSETGVSPTLFSNSVHNAAVSYISRALKIKGPTWTVTGFDRPFEHAVELAEAWLKEDRCDAILLGGGDEVGTVMEYICSKKLPIASDGHIQENAYVPGEGVGFVLVRNSGDSPIFLALNDRSSLFGNMLSLSALNFAAYFFNNDGRK